MQDDDILYQWYFSQMLIEGLENYDLILPPFTPELAGDFYFTATHAALPNLTMQSGITTLVEETTSTVVAENSFLHIYPNPTPNDVVLKSDPAILPYQIKLFTANGNLLQNRIVQDHQTNLSLQGYPSGLYLLQSITPTDNTMTRILNMICYLSIVGARTASCPQSVLCDFCKHTLRTLDGGQPTLTIV